MMLAGSTVLATGYNITLLRQRKETNALIARRMSEVEAEQNAAMGIYAPGYRPSDEEVQKVAAQRERAAKLLADMQEQQRQKEEEKQRRKALWKAKQEAGKTAFQIRGDPDNAPVPAAGGAETAQAAAPAT